MVVLKMDKIDVGTYGEVYQLEVGNIESPNNGKVTINITEGEFNQLKPLFDNCTKHGKFNEHETYI